MHPESDIARKFWVYVTQRAKGDVLGQYPWPHLVVLKEMLEFDGAVDRGEVTWPESEGTPIWEKLHHEDDGLPPRDFPTLQDALYDYLLAHVDDPEIGFKYDVWLRAVALILADAARNPGWLTVKVEPGHDSLDLTDHTMQISDDWSVLAPHTFAYVRRLWRSQAKGPNRRHLV